MDVYVLALSIKGLHLEGLLGVDEPEVVCRSLASTHVGTHGYQAGVLKDRFMGDQAAGRADHLRYLLDFWKGG